MSDATEALSRVDTAWLRMDTDVNLMMIVGVWLLQPAIRCDALVERIRQRLLPYPRFRARVAQGALASSWVVDDNFDLARHVVLETLPRRRGQTERAALQLRMGELASTPLDQAHPLWQFHFIAHYEGGSALICRIHHCIGDGVALNSVVMSIADEGVTPPQLAGQGAGPCSDQAGPASRDEPDTHQGDWVSDELLRPLTGLAVKAIEMYGEGLVKSMQALAHPRQTWREALGLLNHGRHLLGDLGELALMPNDARTSLKGHGNGRKVMAWCEPLPLDKVRAVAKALDASINDVLLSCVAGAIGRYLRDRGEVPAGQDIRAMVPVNLRPLEEAWQLGNRFGLLPLLVPVGIANPVERLAVVRQRMTALKRSFQPLLTYGILTVSGLLTRRGQQALSGLFLDKTTAVMTNVPGPREALKVCGATLKQTIFWVPSSGDVGLGVSIISYGGGVQLALVTDQQLCPEPSRIIDRFGIEFEQLLLLTLMLPWAGQGEARPT